MRIVCRDDDVALLHWLRDSTALGHVGYVKARGSSHPQAQWTVAAKSDCVRLSEILDSAPLRGRKSLDYAIWRAAVNWWVGPDATDRPARRDWQPMIYLKRRLHHCKRYAPDGCPAIIDTAPGLDGDWGSYLAGFLTAEGSMGILHNGDSLFPGLTVRLRLDDYGLLQQFRCRTGLGRLYIDRPRASWRSPVAMWLVRRADELPRLVQILDRHRLRGRKAREYAVWRDAALLFASNEPRSKIRSSLRALRGELADARRYSASQVAVS